MIPVTNYSIKLIGEISTTKPKITNSKKMSLTLFPRNIKEILTNTNSSKFQ